MHRPFSTSPLAATFALLLLPLAAAGAEIYGGIGTTGGEIGIAQPLGITFGLRLEGNALGYRSHFNADGIEYDTRLKTGNAALFVDGFVAGGLRVTGGALVGSRKFHGTARSLGSTVTINGVVYPVGPGDALDFDARFPTVTPYLGLGWGHRAERSGGLQVYADAGVAYGRPKVTLSPSPSLALKVSPTDLAAQQVSVQDKADRYRLYRVIKLGVGVAF